MQPARILEVPIPAKCEFFRSNVSSSRVLTQKPDDKHWCSVDTHKYRREPKFCIKTVCALNPDLRAVNCCQVGFARLRSGLHKIPELHSPIGQLLFSRRFILGKSFVRAQLKIGGYGDWSEDRCLIGFSER
jgi:hypothetical protein